MADTDCTICGGPLLGGVIVRTEDGAGAHEACCAAWLDMWRSLDAD